MGEAVSIVSGSQALPPSSAIVSFWTRLADASEIGGVLSLPEGVSWFGDSTGGFPRRVFVRACYRELWRQIVGQLERARIGDNVASAQVGVPGNEQCQQQEGCETHEDDDDDDEEYGDDVDDDEHSDDENDGEANEDADDQDEVEESEEDDDETSNSDANEEDAIQDAAAENTMLSPLKYDPTFFRLVVLGSPGIGKSMFGLYLLWKLRLYMRDGATSTNCYTSVHCVDPATSADNHSLRFHMNGTVSRVYNGTDASFELYRSRREVMLVDGVPPRYGCSNFTVLITSPKRTVWWTFMKQGGATRRFVPPFTLDELLACRSACFPHVSTRLVHDAFARWGGVARYVLQHAGDRVQQMLLDSAIKSVDMKRITTMLGENDAADDTCHRLLHYQVIDGGQPPLSYVRMQFASAYVAERAAAVLLQNERESFLGFLRAFSRDRTLASLCGDMFEKLAHSVLTDGGSFQLRRLTAHAAGAADPVYSLTIPKCRPHTIRLWQETRPLAPPAYVRPNAKNMTAVDSLLVLERAPVLTHVASSSSTIAATAAASATTQAPVLPASLLLQMTVSLKHPIKADGITSVLAAGLPGLRTPTQQIALVFVVPDHRFLDFREQPILGNILEQRDGGGGATSGKRRKKASVELVQYALQVSLKGQF